MLELCNHRPVVCKILLEHGLLGVGDIVRDLLQLASSGHVLRVHLLDVCCQSFALQHTYPQHIKEQWQIWLCWLSPVSNNIDKW